MWLGPKATGSETPEKVHLKYVFGSMAAGHEAPIQEEEDVDVTNRDQAGNFVTGRKLDTTGLGLGTYRLVVSATRPEEHRSAYAAMNFTVRRGEDLVDVWTAYAPTAQENDVVDDLKRGLSAQVQGADPDAKAWFTGRWRKVQRTRGRWQSLWPC